MTPKTSKALDNLNTKLTETRQRILLQYRSHHVVMHNSLPDYVRDWTMAITYHKHTRVADMAHGSLDTVLARLSVLESTPALHFMAILYG